MKRYSLEEQQYGSCHMVYWDKSMVEDADGEWVKHSDLAVPSAANGAEQDTTPLHDDFWELVADCGGTKDLGKNARLLQEWVKAYARAAVLAEREAIAKVFAHDGDNHIADAIRART